MVGIQLTGQNLFKVLDTESFTVPEVATIPSPTSDFLTKSQDTKRQTVGGQLYATFTDEAGLSQDINVELHPRDVVAVAAIAAGKADVTVNGERVAIIGDGAATIAGVLGFWS